MKHGVNYSRIRHAADYVDKILKGAKPDRYASGTTDQIRARNHLKTAKAIGLTIPEAFLMTRRELTSEVIESVVICERDTFTGPQVTAIMSLFACSVSICLELSDMARCLVDVRFRGLKGSRTWGSQGKLLTQLRHWTAPKQNALHGRFQPLSKNSF